MRLRKHYLVVPLAAFAAILPMLFTGPSCGHDFDFHLLSWLEAANQFAHGGYPHWADTPAWNAGEPRFLFYPPLSWTLGAALGLLLPWKAVPVVFTWLALTASGFSARRLLRRFAGSRAATVAAVVYLANPYLLFTAYERTAYGELLAAAWFPLLFAAALAPRLRPLALALPVALLWLTNAPAGVMGCYALAFLILAGLALPRSRGTEGKPSLALKAAAGTLLGLALAAFYLLPAAWERPWVQSSMAVIGGMRIADNTLFHHMLPVSEDNLAHDLVLHTASTIALGLVLAIACCAAVLLRRQRTRDQSTYALLLLTLAIAFLLTPISTVVWAHLPQLAFLQFPWRLCALLDVVVVLLGARLLPSLTTLQSLAACTLVAALLIVPAWRLFHQPCFPEDTVEARVALFHSPLGTDPTDEYTPTDADQDALHQHNPPWWSACEAQAATPNFAAPAGAAPGALPESLTVSLPCPSLLVLNRRQFPAWHVLVDGKPAPFYTPERDDGLITLRVPAGTTNVEVRFARTPDRSLGIVVSLLAALAAIVMRTLFRTSSVPARHRLHSTGSSHP